MGARADSDRISEVFAAGSRDVTPASVRHVAHVLYAPVSYETEVTRRCASVLSDTELERAERYVKQNDKILFKQRRAFRRYCGALALGSSQPLSQIVFNETENGRPHLSDLPNFCFSFSSCRFGFIAAWSSANGIGVDIEDQSRDLETRELAQQFFSVAEAGTIDASGGLVSLHTFYKFWTLKEAALKSIGEGLPLGLDAFEFELDPVLRLVQAPPDHGQPHQFDAHLIKGNEGCAALVLRNLTQQQQ